MNPLRTVAAVREWRRSQNHVSLGFVPTMGALHAGHGTLVQQARQDCDRVLVSLFVNPAQFNDPKDLAKYPRTEKEDLALLREAGVDAVFIPQAEEIYADRYRFNLVENEQSRTLCGASRPGHFAGVLTVVLKLLHLVQPTRAYFGEKDFQQLTLIRDMVKALFLDLQVVAVPTVRESDGLAMSSRNRLLTPLDRERAPLLYRTLREAATCESARLTLEQAGFKVDYLQDLEGRRYAAAFLGEVRLIDNVEI